MPNSLIPVRAYNKKHLNSVIVEAYICDICNYGCWYCYNERPRTQQHISLKSLYVFLQFLHDRLQKNVVIILIGGEPTLHPNLIDFCHKCSNYDYITIVTYTNFSLGIDFYNKLIDSYNVKMLLSFHSSQCNVDDFVSKLSKISDKTSIYDLNVVVDPMNFEKCIQLFDYVRNQLLINVASLTLVKCKSNNKKITIDNYQSLYTKKQLSIIKSKSANAPTGDFLTIEYNDSSSKEIDTANIDQNDINFYLWRCDAGKSFFYVDKTGYIYPCNIDIKNQQKRIGNLSNVMNIRIKQSICQHKICYDGINTLKTRIFYN